MTMLQKLLARFKSWLFVEEQKKIKHKSKKFKLDKVGPASRATLMKRLRKSTFVNNGHFKQHQAQNRLAQHQKSPPMSFERSRTVTCRPVSEPTHVQHTVYVDHGPDHDNDASNLLILGLMANALSQPSTTVVTQAAAPEIIMPQAPVHREPEPAYCASEPTYHAPEPCYTAPEPEPYRAPDSEPSWSSTDYSSSDTSSFTGD